MKSKKYFLEKIYCQGASLFAIDFKREEKDQKYENKGEHP
jgi:hypothetical protein